MHETRADRRPALGCPWRYAWLLAVLVCPLFAHGCHTGDHDDELSASPPAGHSPPPEESTASG